MSEYKNSKTQSNYQKLIEQLGPQRVKRDESMRVHTTFKIGGPADLYYIATNQDELVEAIRLCRWLNIPSFVLGGGSKILVSDKGFRGLVIKNAACGYKVLGYKGRVREKKIEVQKVLVEAESGIMNARLVSLTKEGGLSGLEFLTGIPGTFGGAIRFNARFRDLRSFHEYFIDFRQVKDRHVEDVVERVKILDRSGRTKWLSRADCGFVYEGSRWHSRLEIKRSKEVILSARVRLDKAKSEIIQEMIEMYAQWRAGRAVLDRKAGKMINQPRDLITGSKTLQPPEPSAGCIFSNIPNPGNHPTGRLVDLCGLRGTQIGGAKISEKHANFIVNVGSAKASDVIELIEFCKKRIRQRFGLDLKEEIEYVGEF
jgi:UDP-N-acetylmuramate dehydrogenase